MKKFDEKLYLADMYEDEYFPDFLVWNERNGS